MDTCELVLGVLMAELLPLRGICPVCSPPASSVIVGVLAVSQYLQVLQLFVSLVVKELS